MVGPGDSGDNQFHILGISFFGTSILVCWNGQMSSNFFLWRFEVVLWLQSRCGVFPNSCCERVFWLIQNHILVLRFLNWHYVTNANSSSNFLSKTFLNQTVGTKNPPTPNDNYEYLAKKFANSLEKPKFPTVFFRTSPKLVVHPIKISGLGLHGVPQITAHQHWKVGKLENSPFTHQVFEWFWMSML